MVEFPACRSWYGVRDSVHPLARAAHSAVAHGRYIYILNGYAPTENGRVIFDRAGLTRFDTLTNMVTFLPVHWDPESLVRSAFVEASLVVAGNSAAICTDSGSGHLSIYTFAGYSLLTNVHINALVRLDLDTNPNPPSGLSAHASSLQLRPSCCRATILSGHGILSALVSLPLENPIFHAIGLACLRTLKHRLVQAPQLELSHQTQPTTNPHLQPSPRDKLCMEYWKGRLFAFGGYGPNFKPPSTWPVQFIQWPFLFDPTGSDQWVLCNDDNGWNNQLIVFDLSTCQWFLVPQSQMIGQPPIPRAAHRSTLLADRGWMFVFGGRGPYSSTSPPSRSAYSNPNSSLAEFSMGRLNDLHCLNLDLFEWTRVTTPLDTPTPPQDLGPLWPCGRSWMDITILDDSRSRSSNDWAQASDQCFLSEQPNPMDSRAAAHLFVLGGWSNTDEPLDDAYLVRLNYCREHGRLEAQTVACSERVSTSGVSTVPDWFGPIKPRLVKNPSIVNGFRCSAKCAKNPFSSLTLTPDDARPVFDQPEPDWELSQHILVYQQANFQATPSLPNPVVHPTEAFYQIARLHCRLTQFLVDCFGQICVHQGSLGQHGPTSALIKELDDLCAVFTVLLQPPGPILSKLIRLFLRCLAPWSILQMLVTETNAWVNQPDQQTLLGKLSSDRLYSKPMAGNLIKLDFADQSVIDKFILLLTPNKVHIPNPYQDQATQLTSFTHQVVASIFTCSGRSPLVSCTDDLSALPNPGSIAGSSHPFDLSQSGLAQPATRFWHTLTCISNGCVYAIGGTNRDASQISVESFRLFGPPKLGQLCLEQAARLVLPVLLERMIREQNSRRNWFQDCKTNRNPKTGADSCSCCCSTSPALVGDQDECIRELVTELDRLLTEPVRNQLLRLLV